MFTTELANIYSKKPYLNNIIPFHEIAPQVEQFLIQEIRLGANNFNPYRFSYKFAHDPKDVINLFIAFSSSEGPLRRLYRFECGDCDEMNVLNDEQLKHFKCYNCGSRGNLEDGNFLENVKVIFEIKDHHLKEFKKRLKDQASSDFKGKKDNSKSEGAKNGDISLKDVFEAKAEVTEPLDTDLDELENSLLHTLSFGLGSI